MHPRKDHFLLDPDVVFLNHGSYGATPRPVFEACQQLRLRLEREPVQFINNELPALLRQARVALGEYLNADPDDLVYVPNATFGMNAVARSLPLTPGDEVLATDHEYGAIDNALLHICRQRGARYIRQPVSFPAVSDAEIVEELWRGVTPRTRVLLLSHISSSTALRFPVETLCARARAAGILTVVDGAHAPGQIALDLRALDADFYAGNCHKWLCSPKGAAFLYTRRELQHLIEPPVVGWGFGDNRMLAQNPDYVDALQWLGTSDPSAYLAVPAAIAFQREHDWPQVRAECHRLLTESLQRVSALTGLEPLYCTDSHYVQMAVNALPPVDDLAAFNRRLFDRHRIEIPCIKWNGRQFLRIALQAYNGRPDIDALLAALSRELAPSG